MADILGCSTATEAISPSSSVPHRASSSSEAHTPLSHWVTTGAASAISGSTPRHTVVLRMRSGSFTWQRSARSVLDRVRIDWVGRYSSGASPSGTIRSAATSGAHIVRTTLSSCHGCAGIHT